MVPGYQHHAGQPLRLDGAAQPARLPRHRDQRGDGLRARRRAPASTTSRSRTSSPSRFTNGRAARLEENFLELTGARCGCAPYDPNAWEPARADVDAGRPALLLTDLYYLDHYGRSAHFPGHAVVLAGYDDESPTSPTPASRSCRRPRLENLARHGSHTRLPARRPHVRRDPRRRGWTAAMAAAPAAIERAARQMLEPAWASSQGLRRCGASPPRSGTGREAPTTGSGAPLPLPGDRAPGTGGGNFRRMYSASSRRRAEGVSARRRGRRALDRAGACSLAPPASEDDPDPTRWSASATEAARVLEAEEPLWTALAGALGHRRASRSGRRNRGVARARPRLQAPPPAAQPHRLDPDVVGIAEQLADDQAPARLQDGRARAAPRPGRGSRRAR